MEWGRAPKAPLLKLLAIEDCWWGEGKRHFSLGMVTVVYISMEDHTPMCTWAALNRFNIPHKHILTHKEHQVGSKTYPGAWGNWREWGNEYEQNKLYACLKLKRISFKNRGERLGFWPSNAKKTPKQQTHSPQTKTLPTKNSWFPSVSNQQTQVKLPSTKLRSHPSTCII